MAALPLYAQLINLLAAILLLLAFAMLAQRRVMSLIDLFAAQGLALSCSTAIVAYGTHQTHLYFSAGLTLLLKVLLLPWLLHRLIRKLDVKWDVEGLINVPTTMIIGLILVVFHSTSPCRFPRSPAPSRARRRHCDGHGDAVVPR
jgi:hydrogenase-4 component E